ncbi:apolipoprotein Bb, tandem duplicate 1 [Acanthochromis polyacanthus]|uniref:apolipoprotein Bb, tandem duplicate 1 n=1 Tax=Acanthochromis polyacanthus TaxID=80966 RepID=UPI002233E417|nr:apolipoprotein Bb, tandem duplicate 1 [Acanthochromis polyacanthus]
MGDSKLCLLLLLSTSALTFAQDDQPTCLLAQRYKTLHKYEYQYEAESLNAINGASPLKNGPKASCKVEIEVPQTCSFIIRTTGCQLNEVVDVDAEGNPVFGPAPSSDTFAAEMERYPLKVMVEGEYDVKLYPENGETTTVLNFKRGIVSALAVPLVEEKKNKRMPTIHGKCKTYYTINAREDIATDISLERDLSRCDKFNPIRHHTSPLALISGMHYPLSKMIRSSQTCNYKFDNEKKHMTSGSCTENHILIPFSHKGQYGVTNIGKQELTLVQVAPHNDRVFDHSDIMKELHMDAVEDKSVVQDKDAALTLLRELATLPETNGDRRAHLFQKLVSMVRAMKTETLTPAIPEALEVSRVLTYQVLAQCGTPECSSAIMHILRTFDTASLEVDAAVFAMGIMSNPSALLIHDLLEMAKYKSSKPIMYALSNVVKRFYKQEGKLIPEIYSVAEFMAAQLGDCTGDKDNTFMTLRVIGNMAPAVIPAGPALRGAVMQCMNQPAASPAVQQAAIQVFRLTPVPEEVRGVFMQVLLDSTSPVQKRIAAYLVLMKDPRPSELTQLANVLPREQDQQVKSFVISHITNILSSSGPETQELRQKIRDALQDNEIGTIMDPTKFSRNYKIGSLEGNMIFEDTSYLPKELMLEMTLKAFGFDIDMMEIGMEGKGFEPTVDALFGENGFFPDTALKTMYFVSDNMPRRVNEILRDLIPSLRKKQASQNLLREIGHNLNKLVREVKSAESPEAMVYLRLLGNELGYLRTNEMEEMAYSAAMMIDSMLKMFPADLMKALMTKADNTIFAHYIFMDNEFFLPTVTGVPLRVSLSGTFTPGIKGGLKIARDMSEVTFMPSAGIEFVTRIGSHIPEYVNSGLEMHTNMFHESGLNAKLSVKSGHFKLTIPAPSDPTKLIKVTNNLVAVTGSEVKTIPPMVMDKVDVRECTPVFAGMKYCSELQYTDAFSQETAPFFPFTGDSKLAVEFHPTGEVTEYTATVEYKLLKEGDEGRQKVDSVNFILRAEGADPTEARAVVKYNRKKNAITADIQIPDYDVEAGLRLGVVDGNTKGKGTHSISLDFINKNIPVLSLVGRANLKAMKEGMLQVQLLVPSINADATVTANMKRDAELELEVKSDIKFQDMRSEQEIDMKYDGNKIEVEVKSDMNTKTTVIFTDFVETYGNDFLDMQVGQTDMKVRHIFKKFVEAANNYMEKYGADYPYIQNFRVPDMPEISLPDTLFLNAEAKGVYHFNEDRITIPIPVPLGGKSTEDLKFPPALTTPSLSLPQFGLEIVSMEIPIPEFIVPESFTLSIPRFGKAEVSTVMKSNLYDMEASMAVGKDVVETPSYSAKFDVTGTSPIEILSVKMEGSGMLASIDSMKAQLKTSLTHKFIEATFSITEDATITDKINLKSSSKMEAKSPLGLNVVLEHNGMFGINTEEMSANNNFEGKIAAGPIYGKTTSVQSLNIFPFRPEAKFDSTVQLDSTFVKTQNQIAATLLNGEFLAVSNTNAFEDTFTHVADVSFKDSKLSLKCDANAFAFGMKIRNQAEASAGAGEMAMKMETNADHSDNRVYSLLTASLDVNGLAVNSDASVNLLENEATHKASLKMNKDGLTTSGTTTLQSPLSFENTFDAGLDSTRASLSINNKAAVGDMKVDNANTLIITLSSLDFTSKAEATASEYASYTHDVTFDLKPYSASANVNNNLKLLNANFINEAQLQAELYKMDLTGSLKAIYGEEEIKHTYQVSYADMSGNAKCSTTGKLFGTHLSHNTELEVIGLAARISNDARFNSQPVRFDHTIRCSIVPFDFNLDAIFNADGDMTMYGKHSAQLYGKFLVKAQPLAFASSHECRASVNQQLNNGLSLETTVDNKMDTVLSLQEQKTSFRMKSKLNEHAFNQDISIYNTAEGTGIEASGTILTNIINSVSADNQEFAISGFLKYDKNRDYHIIQLPLIEILPAFLENIKGFVVHLAEALQDYINNDEVRAKLEALPEQISDFVAQMNIEEKAIQLLQSFTDLTQNYVISMEDVEASLRNLKITVEKLLADLTVYLQNFVSMMKETILSGNFPERFAQQIQDMLNAIDEEFDIKGMLVYVIDTIRDMVHEIDLDKLKDSSIAFLYDIDTKYEIKTNLKDFMNFIREMIERFDLAEFVSDLVRFISHEMNHSIRNLVSRMPTKILSEAIDKTLEIIQNLNIIDTINAFYAKMRELIVKFEFDKKIQSILEKAVELIKQYRIEETISAGFKMVKDADIPSKLMQVFQDVINYLKITDVKDIIQHVNRYIESTVQKLNSLEYNDFVDYSNQVISEYTTYVNEMIRTLEIPQKLQATRDFVNLILSSVRSFMEHLREIKVAEILKSVKEISSQVVFDNFKALAQFLKEKITNLDVKAEISSYLECVSKYYRRVMSVFSGIILLNLDIMKSVVPDQKIISEIQQIMEGLLTELKRAEIILPSFTIPFTDLVVPSMTFTMNKLQEFEIPTQFDIPEFTILGYTVKATTVSVDDIKQKIIELIDFILNFEINMYDVDAFFGELTLDYLPSMPEIAIPEITLPEFSFPTIPQVPVEKLVKSLQVPEIKLPSIPSEIMVPSFGKLYGELKFHTPIYTLKTTAELQNSTEKQTTPQFTGFFTSQGTSPSFEILSYKLESTGRFAIAKRSRMVLAETLKFNHQSVGVEHQGSVTVYGLSAQAQAKTSVKVTTAPYTANFENTAYIGMVGGMSASLDTTYNHVVDLPFASVRSEATMTQKSVARQDGNTLTLTADNSGNGKINDHTGNHNSKLHLSFTPSISTLTFSGDTDSSILKMKQLIGAELGTFTYFKFNVRNEAEAPFIKNSLLVANGHVSLPDMKVELKANHDTEMSGAVSGDLSNSITFKGHLLEFVSEFQNKANAKVSIFESLTAKIELQNDYSASFSLDSQQINTIILARLNQYKAFCNFTLDNNVNEAGIFVAMDGEANLDFLKYPISIPEIDLPYVDFHTPAISDLNLYEQIGMENILTTTEQTVDVNAKIVYKKSRSAPLVDMMGLVQIPSVGNLITELSLKSAIINLNVNAGMDAEDDLVFRLGATTASVFESLKAKLDGTTSLTTKRGIKLANSLSLENPHIKGTHGSTISVSTDTWETDMSVATVAKVALSILNMEVNQNLVADTKTKANAVSEFNVKSDFNIPMITAAGKVEINHNLKIEGTFEYVSMDFSTKGNTDGKVFEEYLVLGILDNEANLYLNRDGLRSTSKVIADAKLNSGTTKVIGMDVNENLEIEASLSRVYAVLKYTGNNEANVFNFNTKGKHIAQATIDFAPTSSLTADIETDMSQQTSLGDFALYEKTVAEVTGAKQKISTNVKFASPVYTTNMVIEVEGSVPVFKIIYKLSATSPIVILEYDLDAFTTTNFEDDIFSMNNKAVLKHADLTMGVNHVITQAFGSQADDSSSAHTLNVDIISPTFTDVSLHYAARRDGTSASVSTPSSGFLGLHFSGRVPSQMSARFYGRYPSTPDVDVDILVVRSSPKDADKMSVQINYNMEAPKAMLSELKMKLPSIFYTFTAFANKYHITDGVETVKDFVTTQFNDAYTVAINYDDQLSQLSVFFRNIIVQYQKTVQVFLDAAIKVLRETKFKLPGSDELTTLPEVLKQLTSSIAGMLDATLQIIFDNMEIYYNSFVESISNMKVRMPVGDAISGGQIIDQVKSAFKQISAGLVDFVKNMESLDTMLEKIGETLKAIVDKTQEFVDSIKSDYLDAVFMKINEFYRSLVTAIMETTELFPEISTESLSRACERVINSLIFVIFQFNEAVSGFLQQGSHQAEAYIKVTNGKLEIDLPFPFQQ